MERSVEINCNLKEECWHLECYMIHKRWYVKVVSRPTSSLADLDSEAYGKEEAEYDATALEETCSSDMLLHISNGMYLEVVRLAEKFVLHVEVLFAVIDEFEAGFARAGAKGMSHAPVAWTLCSKTADLFRLLLHTQDFSSLNSSQVQSWWVDTTQDLLALVDDLAHYLKLLIGIALTGALKLKREHSNGDVLHEFLDRIQCLVVDGADPNAKRQQPDVPTRIANGSPVSEDGPPLSLSAVTPSESIAVHGSEGVAYGYRSLDPGGAGEPPFSPKSIVQTIHEGASSVLTLSSDLCVACRLEVVEDCVRLGTYQRWHSHCVKCVTCGKVAAVAAHKGEDKAANAAEAGANGSLPKNQKTPQLSWAKRPPANVDDFRYEPLPVELSSSSDKIPHSKVVIYCTAHATSDCRSGFSAVSRLEQYAFLLKVPLRGLYVLLYDRGVLNLPATSSLSSTNSNFSTKQTRTCAGY